MIEYRESYFEGELRDGFYVESKMKRAWAAQIEVLEEIKRVCKKHDIRFFADWGTLLGTVRHGGFIPWDDDLDIGMLRNDYMRFLEIAPTELGEIFRLKSVYCDSTHNNVKARIITGTSMNFEKAYLQRFHGCPYVVGVDIFPIDYIPREKGKSEMQNKMIEMAMTIIASIPETPPYSKEEMELVNKFAESVGAKIDQELPIPHELKKIVDRISAFYGPDDGDEVCSMIDLAMGWDYHAKKEWYAKSIEMPFEQTTIPVPIGYEGILQIKYSDEYMTPIQGASSHDYPFYEKQEQALADVIKSEYQITLTKGDMEKLIEEKIEESLR